MLRVVALVAVAVLVGCGSTVTMKGVVHDRQTEAPISGAVVSVEGSGQAATNENGAYLLKVEASDEPVNVAVSAPDYFPVSEMRSFLPSGQEIRVVNFEMLAHEDLVRKRERLGESAPNVNVTTVTPTTNVSSPPSVGSQASQPVNAFCPSCGMRREPGSRFCVNCGRQF